jgi:two-component system, NarL family, sensor histidine kinase DegS
LARYNLQEARRSVAGLRPLPLDGKSLLEALKTKALNLRSQHNLEIEVISDGQPRPLQAEVETGLFRIVEEALSNVIRHAGATRTQISLDYDEDDICLTVLDDGRGFEITEIQKQNANIVKSFGLSIMKERTSLTGGWLTVQSSKGQGCRVRVIVPYQAVLDELKPKKGAEVNVAG